MLYHRDVLKAVSLAVSTDETRPALTGVYLDGSGRVVGCDGHILLCIQDTSPGLEKFPRVEGLELRTEPVIVPVKPLAEACKATPKNGALPILQRVVVGKAEGDKIRLVATDLDRTHNAEVRIQQGTYPAWEKVMPTGEAVVKTALGVDVVLKLFKALKAAGCETVNVDLTSGVTGWKIEGVTKEMNKALAILMPCRRAD